ncbi:hypothetical protein AB0C34_17500 [Nocardia sp. NPDC049220]|uniref:hypothetical protein n=1 Tax=Nocardia sp. NPDC049220 TaxID=3155273 RepID=UPI0033F97297
MGYLKAGRPVVGRKYEVRLEEVVAKAVSDYAETRWPGNKHGAGMARRELITHAIYAHQEANNIMSLLDIVILDTSTDAAGMEWGLALEHAPGIDTDEVQQFLIEQGAGDADLYALVVPDELWDNELNGRPYIKIQVPQLQAAALKVAIGEYGKIDEYVEPESEFDFGDSSAK